MPAMAGSVSPKCPCQFQAGLGPVPSQDFKREAAIVAGDVRGTYAGSRRVR